jgi:hypothetical protein
LSWSVDEALIRMAQLPAAEFLRGSGWAYPLVEIVHLAGMAVLIGSIVIVDLRLIGAGRALPLDALMRFVLPWTVASLLLIVPSGVLLFLAHAPELAGNRAFIVKLLLLALAGSNALLFHRTTRTGASIETGAPARAKVAATVSLVLWVSVIAAGRLTAYM